MFEILGIGDDQQREITNNWNTSLKRSTMSRSQLKYWPVLYCLDDEFIAEIKIVLVYGKYAERAVMVLEDDSVYEVGTNVVRISDSGESLNSLWKPAKLDELSDKGVKDFVWSSEYGVAALTDKGEVYYWTQTESEAPCAMDAAMRPSLMGGFFYEKSIVQISWSSSRLIGLTENGEVLKYDVVSKISENMTQSLLSKMSLASPAKYIACSSSHIMIVTTCGQPYSWDSTYSIGPAKFAQLIPRRWGELRSRVFVRVACGYSHALFLSENGNVYVWGTNSYGQLGIDTVTGFDYPVEVISTRMGKVVDIAAISSDHISAALTCTGQVFVWGRCRGQIVSSPTLTPFSTLREVFAAYAHPNVMHSSLILHDEDNEEGEADVIESLRQAFDNPSNSDFAITVEEKPIHVHKSILGIRSVYFQSLFREQWAENNQSTLEHKDFPYDVYRAFLKYLYTSEIDVQEEKLIELLALANAYCELQLKRRCAEILGKDIQLSNVLRLYVIAVTHGSTELEDLCMKFASNHMSVIGQSPEFAMLSAETVKAFTIKAAATGAFN